MTRLVADFHVNRLLIVHGSRGGISLLHVDVISPLSASRPGVLSTSGAQHEGIPNQLLVVTQFEFYERLRGFLLDDKGVALITAVALHTILV